MDHDELRERVWSLQVELGVIDEPTKPFALPAGTVTFLLADLETTSQGTAVGTRDSPEARARLDDVLDAVIALHGGVRLVDLGSNGNAVGAFGRPSDAVAAALDAQAGLIDDSPKGGGGLLMRIAIHTGEAQLREDGNYVGQTLSRAERLRSIAHGGQVLLSGASTALILDRLPANVSLIDLGNQRLSDLGRAEHVWQATRDGLPASFPPLRSLDAYRQNLPLQLTPLFGRSDERREVCELLRRERLITLTGSAGVGKTRLALAVAGDALADVGSAWFVELAGVSDPELVGRAVLAALGTHERAGTSPARQLAAELGDERALIVLDNCEHIVDACATFATELLAATPATAVLTTSRESLGVPGEVVWRVAPLSCATPERRLGAEALSQYDSVALFADRARRAMPSFEITDANAPSVAQICHRLDGIPLAIELAAARCGQLSAERIATELDDRFRTLTGGSRTLMARQQTLAASIDWSHERLDAAERAVFRRIGVFAGRFPSEAVASIVAAFGDIDGASVDGLLTGLADKSLVAVESAPDGQPCYRLLETLRVYALDRLVANGEVGPIRDAHAAWWSEWLEPRAVDPAADDFAQVDLFYDNVRAAMSWVIQDPGLGLRMLYSFANVCQDLGRAGDAVTAAERLLTPDNATLFPSWWLSAAGATSIRYDLVPSYDDYLAFVERMRAVASRLDDGYHLALARFLTSSEPDDAVTLRALADDRGESWVAALACAMHAQTIASGDPSAAEGPLREAEAVAIGVGSQIPLDFVRRTAGRAARDTGQLARSLTFARQLTTSSSQLITQNGVHLLGEVGLLAEDETAVRDAITIAEQLGRPDLVEEPNIDADRARHQLSLLDGTGGAWLDPALLATRPLNPGTLWIMCREAIDVRRADVALNVVSELQLTTPHATAVRAAIQAAASGDEDRWHQALDSASTHGLALITIDALEGLAVAAGGADSNTECLRLLGAAERLREETGYHWRFAAERLAVRVARTAAIMALGDDAAQAEAEGRTLTRQEAVAYAARARGQRNRPRHGWASLTPTERRVVALVAEGLTNPQIAERLLMGRATVKSHLEHIFPKLGVRTRAELAAMATREASESNSNH